MNLLNEQELNKPYRPGGWTLRQLIHHLADSHANSLTRFKLALTENNPTIKPYEEAEWAKQADYNMPVAPALKMLEGIHERWAYLLKNMSDSDFERTFYHPESKISISLKKALALYNWHCLHHLAHLQNALIA